MSAHAHSYSAWKIPTQTQPGQPLWGEAPRRQPIAPLILMAVILLVVAAPSALAANGNSRNPLALMRSVAESTYRLTGLMKTSNAALITIDDHTSNLAGLAGEMGGIAEATEGMETSTTKLSETLGGVGSSVASSSTRLASVNDNLSTTASGMGPLADNVDGSLASTKSIVGLFGTIDTSISGMDTKLTSAIGAMKKSGPLTTAFASNRTRVPVTGGNPAKYNVPNAAAGTPVMSIVLPMIATMQNGGPLPARKDRHVASNVIVGTALRAKVPDGTNVVALVRPYDGFYGLPPQQYFIERRVNGF